MEIKQKKREEIEEKYKWDLSSIYKNDEEFLKDIEKLSQSIKKLKKFEKTMMQSAQNLYNCLQEYMRIDCNIEKLYLYSHCKYDQDTSNSTYQKYYGKMMNLINEYEKESSFIIPTLMKYNYKDIEKFYEESEKLKDEYEIYLKGLYRNKKYMLSETEEKLLSSISKAMNNSEDIYNLLTNSDFSFDYITLENKEKVELTDSNYSIYISSKNRNVRKQAFDLMYKTYKNHKDSIAKCLSSFIEANVTISKLRGYKNALFEALYLEDIDTSIYNNLINTVTNNITPLIEYYKYKKKLLNLDELHMYDIYVSTIDENEKIYTYEQAKDIILNALQVLGDDYINAIKKMFNERCIDVYNNKGKTSGAYSTDAYNQNPFILLNFEGRFDDVSALIHELGHSVHTYFSNKNNIYQYSRYSIFVAEVASTVNELLLSHYMIKNASNKDEKKFILNRLLEFYKASLFKQTMFAEFEKNIYDYVENGEILTSEFLCDEYYKLNEKYFKDSVILDEDIKYEWERVPHFYYFFYVFKYATSISAATYITNEILNGNTKMRDDYLKFLSLGSTKFPVDELKEIGIDMNDSKVIKNAIDYFKEILNEFKALND